MTWWEERSEALASAAGLAPAVDAAGAALAAVLASGGTIYACGNGGSAAQADHLVAELVGRFMSERPPLRAATLPGGGAATASALANDYGFAEVFARALRGLARPGDALVALTTSGQSANVNAALAAAREMGVLTVALTGAAGSAEAADHALAAPTTCTPLTQELHLIWIHRLCRLAEGA